MVFREKALFLWSRLPRRASPQSFCIQKRPPLPFVSHKSILSPAGKRSVRSSKFSDGPQLGIVLEREERSGQRRTLSSPRADPFFSACQSCLVARLSTQAARFILSTALPAFGFRSMQNTLAYEREAA